MSPAEEKAKLVTNLSELRNTLNQHCPGNGPLATPWTAARQLQAVTAPQPFRLDLLWTPLVQDGFVYAPVIKTRGGDALLYQWSLPDGKLTVLGKIAPTPADHRPSKLTCMMRASIRALFRRHGKARVLTVGLDGLARPP